MKKQKKSANSKKKDKEILIKMEFNPMTAKFEPKLPPRKGPLVTEIKPNKWALWYLIIETLIVLLPVIVGTYLFLKHILKV